MSDAGTTDHAVDEAVLAQARVHARSVADEMDVDLEPVEWDVSARAKRRAGACRYDPETGTATIVLSRRAYRAFDPDAFEAIVRHELLHVRQFQHGEEPGHGPRFRELADAFDAPVRCDAFAPPRYVLRCRSSDCDWTADRHRASAVVKRPAAYRCGSCGDRLVVEHVESERTWSDETGYERTRDALADAW